MPDHQRATEFPKWDYQEYPKTLPRDDFWGQVRRTIWGRRVSEEEVALLVDHLRQQLELQPTDVLLELGCGNGALSARLFDDCAGYAGGDLSSYLIGVAQEFFEREPDYAFFNSDAIEFARLVDKPERFTKGLCYALLQYLTPEAVTEVLRVLWHRFPNLLRVVLGNLPNRDKADLFFRDGYTEDDLGQHQSQIGRWWSKDEIGSLASTLGWKVSFTQMSGDIFNAKYRFDAILTRGVET